MKNIFEFINTIVVILLILIPGLVFLRIFYINKLKLTIDYVHGLTKLSNVFTEIEKKNCMTDVDKTIIMLIVIMQQFYLPSGKSVDACLAQLELLKLEDDNEIARKIKSFDINILFSLYQLTNIESGINNETVRSLEKQLCGRIDGKYIEYFYLAQGYLSGWIKRIKPKILKRLTYLNQKKIDNYNLKIKKN